MQIRKPNFSPNHSTKAQWFEANPFKTQLFNAISMSFPFGEGYFIKSFKQIQNAGLIQDVELLKKITLFSAQEAMHSSIHLEFNRYLASQGLNFSLANWFERRRQFCDIIFDIKTQLSVTMAYEHLTAALAYANLKHGWVNDVQDINIRNMWNWHSAEEIEHSSVAHELYEAVNGGYCRRIFGMLYALSSFLFDYSIQTTINLWKTGDLFKLKTLKGCASFLFGKNGLAWIIGHTSIAYLLPNWKPLNNADQLAQDWLRQHSDQFKVIK